jgi:hypothetical protein
MVKSLLVLKIGDIKKSEREKGRKREKKEEEQKPGGRTVLFCYFCPVCHEAN